MNEINDLRDKLLNNTNKGERLKAAEKLTIMASEGNKEAAEILYEMLEKEEDPEVWIKPFEVPPKSKKDKRDRFIRTEEYELSIIPILKKRNISEYQKTTIIKFVKSLIELYNADDYDVVRGAMTILSYLTDENDLFNFVNMWLKKDPTDIYDLLSSLKYYPDILRRIILALRDNPDKYSKKFVEIFDWFLRNPSPDTLEIIGKELWLKLPLKYREAVRLYYMEDLYEHFYRNFEHFAEEFKGALALPVPTKHPFLEWLEGFERGIVTSSITSYSALQTTSEKIGLHLKDAVKQIETHEPSPLTLMRKSKNREPQREENRELIPIDKYLGEYFPDDQLIKLYMTEIHDCAKRLGVSVEALRRVVEFHESAHAVVHLGRDAEGKNFNTGAFKMVDGGVDPSPLHETLAQLFTYHCIKDIPELIKCFEKLNKFQPSAYRKWENFTHIPLERIRNILVGIRQGRIEASFDMFSRILI
jgi:ribosomal protein S6